MAEIGVFHLVRRGNAQDALERFLRSYQVHRPGAEHDLIFILKGFTRESHLKETYAALEGVTHTVLRVPDEGFDITAYMVAARLRTYPYLFFLNSFSEILEDDWLKLFRDAMRNEGIGAVGATGSWQSIYSDYLYRQAQPRRTLSDKIKGIARIFWHWRSKDDFPEFPNYHLRTNAFMIQGDTMRSLQFGRIRTKRDAYRFESGYRSLTRQLEALGLRSLIAGRDGAVYEWRSWDEANTFWTGDQANLIVADNQTRAFERGDEYLRRRLSFHAWRSPPDYDWSDRPPKKERQ